MNNSPDIFPPSTPTPKPPPKEESAKVLLLLGGALLFLIIAAAVGGFIFASSAGIKPGTLLARLKGLTLAREKLLQGENSDRINVLLLGMGGAGHEGATLTDTIILASIRPSDTKIALLSIPRDLQVLIPNYGYRRINAVNAYAELNTQSSGGSETSKLISELLDEPIPYYLRVDFTAFKEIINTVGGIEVDVERTFYDPFYPDENFGYAPVSFEAGPQRMDGERALKFVRSRHGTGGEGNDFARAKRQQKVLLALKARLLSLDVLLRPKRINAILNSLENHLQTNISFWEGMRFAQLIRDIDLSLIVSRVLDASPQGLLRERNYNGAFVLEPKDPTWSQVRKLAEQLFEENAAVSTSLEETTAALQTPQPETTKLAAQALNEPEKNLPLVEVQNGTFVNGLAARVAEKLEALNFNVISLGNAPVRDVQNTVIYDLSAARYPEKFAELKKELQAIDGEGEPLNILRKGNLDFLVILGANATK